MTLQTAAASLLTCATLFGVAIHHGFLEGPDMYQKGTEAFDWMLNIESDDPDGTVGDNDSTQRTLTDGSQDVTPDRGLVQMSKTLVEHAQSRCLHLTSAFLTSLQMCIDCRLEIPDASKVRPPFVRCLHGESLLSLVGTELLVVSNAFAAVETVQESVERSLETLQALVNRYVFTIGQGIEDNSSGNESESDVEDTCDQTEIDTDTPQTTKLKRKHAQLKKKESKTQAKAKETPGKTKWNYDELVNGKNIFDSAAEIALTWEAPEPVSVETKTAEVPNISTQPQAPPQSQLIRAPELQGATFPALVMWLTSHQNVASTGALLHALDTLADPRTLLVLLSQRFGNATDQTQNKALAQARTNVLYVIQLWVAVRWTDFENDTQLLDAVSQFLGSACQGAAWHATAARATLLTVRRKLHQKRQGERWLSRLTSSIGRSSKNSAGLAADVSMATAAHTKEECVNNITPVKLDPKNVSRQLAMMDFEIFAAIEASELRSLRWSGNHKDQLSPNIVRLTNSFNALSGFITLRILVELDLKERARMLKFWILTAKESANIKDFHTAVAILSALNSAGVSRLKRTWKALPARLVQDYTEMSQLMNSKGNFLKYRNAIALPASKNAASEPILPYLGVFLSDLTFIEEGNSTYLTLTDHEMSERCQTPVCCDSDSCLLRQTIERVKARTGTEGNHNHLAMESGECKADAPTDEGATIPDSLHEGEMVNHGEVTRLLINFSRCRLAYNVVHAIKQYQKNAYTYTVDHGLQSYLHSAKTYVMDEKEAFDMSLMLEPRVSSTAVTDGSSVKKHGRTGSTASTSTLLSPSHPSGKSSPPHSPRSKFISQSMNAIVSGIESFSYDSLASKISGTSSDSLHVNTSKHSQQEDDNVSVSGVDSTASPNSPRGRKVSLFSSKEKLNADTTTDASGDHTLSKSDTASLSGRERAGSGDKSTHGGFLNTLTRGGEKLGSFTKKTMTMRHRRTKSKDSALNVNTTIRRDSKVSISTEGGMKVDGVSKVNARRESLESMFSDVQGTMITEGEE